MIYSDQRLSQKLERTEACANANFVESRARLMPESCAEWMDADGVFALFDGVESPATQTFGLGLFSIPTDADFEKLEAFFRQRKAPVFHEVSPMADPSLIPLLNARGYRPIELTSVMYRPLDLNDKIPAQINAKLSTRLVLPHEADHWAKISADGWASEMADMRDFMYQFSQISVRCVGASPFLVELDGQSIATGMLYICGDVAMLAGASTIPEGRNNGAQNALLHSRLKCAAEQGCTLAVMGAAPGSQSQKNAQKNGFKIAYTRIKWQLDRSPTS